MKKRQFMHIANNIRKKESLYGSVSEKLSTLKNFGLNLSFKSFKTRIIVELSDGGLHFRKNLCNDHN